MTYLDMAVRGRPASSTPEKSVERLADAGGVDLGEGERAGNRKADKILVYGSIVLPFRLTGERAP